MRIAFTLICLLLASAACSTRGRTERFEHILIEPQGTFTDVDLDNVEASGLVVRIIESGSGFHEYQAVLQTFAHQEPSHLRVVDAAWENSPRTQCDQITFTFPAGMLYTGEFRACVGLDSMSGDITSPVGEKRRVRLRRTKCGEWPSN